MEKHGYVYENGKLQSSMFGRDAVSYLEYLYPDGDMGRIRCDESTINGPEFPALLRKVADENGKVWLVSKSFGTRLLARELMRYYADNPKELLALANNQLDERRV